MTSRELSDATEDKDGLEEAADIGQGLAKLGREFGRRIDEAEWLGNFQNAHIELANVIRLVDSFFHRDLARRGYASPSFSLDLENLRVYRSWDIDELTAYGQMIMKARFCAGSTCSRRSIASCRSTK